MNWKNILLHYFAPLLIMSVLFTGCGDDAFIDRASSDTGCTIELSEVIEDINGNANGIKVTATQLNAIPGVSGAINGIDYTTALQNATYIDRLAPTAAEIQTVINAVNAQNKVFSINSIGSQNIAENSNFTTSAVTLNGSPTGVVTYSLTGADASKFTVNSSTGVVSMVTRDFENPVDANTDNVYEVTLVATDEANQTASEDISVSVTNVNENGEMTITTIGDSSLVENTVYTSATPVITGVSTGTLTYTLTGADASKFTINSSTGVVSMIARDYESPVDANADNVYEVTLVVTDEANKTDSEDIKVTITDVTEGANITINDIPNSNIAENSSYSVTSSLSGTARGVVTYTLAGVDASKFTVNSTGVLSMVSRDYENPVDANTDNIYEVTLIATDASNNTDNEDINITIVDIVEAVTLNINMIPDTTVSENTNYVSVIPSLTGTAIGNVTYSLIGTDAADFTINSSTGVVSMVARDYENPVDASTNNVYQFSIVVVDEDGNTDSEAWNVTVTDIIESTTLVLGAIANSTLSENNTYTSITPVLTGTPIGTVSYQLTGADAEDFTIDTQTGIVSMVARDYENPVDANSNNTYEIGIIATDQDGNTANKLWTVAVIDAGESVSFTINPIANITQLENSAYTAVTPVLSGGTPVGTVTYTLSGTDASKFTINSSSGVVSMIARDYENPVDANSDNIYELTITATDADNNADLEDWSVTISNTVEGASFIINNPNNTAISENNVYTSGTPVISGNPIGSLTYTLSGTDAADFTINSTTGIVSMVARDYESPEDANTDNIYDLKMIATDQDGNVAEKAWNVTVTDVMEAKVFNITTIADTTIAENSPFTSITPALAGDTPIGAGIYTLSGADAAYFSVDSATGVVSMIARDYESPVDTNNDNIYEVTIIVTDEDGNTDDENFTVTVTDITESVAYTINPINDTTITENSTYTSTAPVINGTVIGVVTYSLTGADASAFTIDSSTGVVSMIAKDYENPEDSNTDNIYDVGVIATDSDNNVASENWTVTVSDNVEARTLVINAIGDISLSENNVYTSITPTIGGNPVGAVTYTLTGNDAAMFTVNPNTGVVSMVARDYENPVDTDVNNIYEVGVIATDADNNTDSELWNVTINNAGESVAFMINDIVNISLPENSIYTAITPVLSGDTPVGTVTYTLGGTDASQFTIDSSTGVVSMVARDYENPSDSNGNNIYEVMIIAIDSDSNSDTETWNITMTDVIESSNFSINNIANSAVVENQTYTSVTPVLSGSPIGTVLYTLSGLDSSMFTIDSSTGVVSMIARDYENPIDADANNIYGITITGTDADGNSATTSWNVNVTNQTEATSFTLNSIADTTVAENTTYNSVTPSLAGSPIGTIIYTLGGADASKFTIDSATGLVSMIARDYESPIDANTNNIYELSIIATDADGNSDSESWNVTVTDVSESDSDGDGFSDFDEGIAGTNPSDPNSTPVPADYTPTMNLSSTNIVGASGEIIISATITELITHGLNAGDLRFSVVKNDKFTLAFDYSNTSNNVDWELTSNSVVYLLKYVKDSHKFRSSTQSNLVLKATATVPSGVSGQFPLCLTIISGSGDTNGNNNRVCQNITYNNL